MCAGTSPCLRWLLLVSIATAASSIASPTRAATDARFEGTYCGDSTLQSCAGAHCTELQLQHLRAQVIHWDRGDGVGLLLGHGAGLVGGQNLRFEFGAQVVGYGEARGSLASNLTAPERGNVSLSADGLELRVVAREGAVVLRKDACGNTAPLVGLSSRGVDPVVTFTATDSGGLTSVSTNVLRIAPPLLPEGSVRFVGPTQPRPSNAKPQCGSTSRSKECSP